MGNSTFTYPLGKDYDSLVKRTKDKLLNFKKLNDENVDKNKGESSSFERAISNFKENVFIVIDGIKNKKIRNMVLAKVRNPRMLHSSYVYADVDPDYMFELIGKLNNTRIRRYVIRQNPHFGEKLSDAIALEALRLFDYVSKNKAALKEKISSEINKTSSKVSQYLDEIQSDLDEIIKNTEETLMKEIEASV